MSAPQLSQKLSEKLQNLPSSPGIYQMYDSSGVIIYIGKAKSLQNRVRSYFRSTVERDITRELVKNISDFSFIVTHSEKDALILENNLIKKHLPYFNISLKDNKTYPYICLTDTGPYPMLIKTREKKIKGKYFGPFTDVRALNEWIEYIQAEYPLKKCSGKRFPRGFTPCLYFQMKKCLGYCTHSVPKEKCDALISDVTRILTGNIAFLIDEIQTAMQSASAVRNYELARDYKHKLDVLTAMRSRQQVVLGGTHNIDVMHYLLSFGTLTVCVLNFSEGRLVNTDNFHFEHTMFCEEGSPENEDFFLDMFASLIMQYYQEHTRPIQELIIPLDLPQSSQIEEVINERMQKPNENKKEVKLIVPRQGDKLRLLELARSNARLSFFERKNERVKDSAAKELRAILKLKKTPVTIESFDIANTGDNAIVAGMVRFSHGKPDKNNYRIFSMQTVTEQNDFQSIQEAVYRRCRRLLEENKPLPDLFLIDGGKGQLSAACAALKSLNIRGQPIISLAKESEEVYVPSLSTPLGISLENPALKLLIKIRDETHRFTNRTHVFQRDKAAVKSILEKIPGFGPQKIKQLYRQFKTLEKIKNASEAEVCALPFFGKKDFERLKEFFRAAGSGIH